MFNLGVCYYNGQGVTQDYKKAFEFYQRAADNGDADAMFNVGNCYYFGRGVTQDYNKAIEFYQRAADKGHVGAMKQLDICCKKQAIQETSG